jgi:5-methylcytosine-specific restriction endonuclease McrA
MRQDDPMLRTKDHVVPKSKKPKGEPGTTVVACWRCNSAKSSAPYEEFKAFADVFLWQRKSPRLTTYQVRLMLDVWLVARGAVM